jgi:divalent metal cation (Fe/Co/Zn/Cd) transporter
MEIECAHCKSKLRLNIHRAELVVVLLNFATIVALGLLAYGFQSQDLVVAAVIAAMAGALAFPVLEHTYLRNWPRYVYP